MKKFLCALCGIALALTYVGCSSDDGEENGGDGGSTDYIVTKDLKQRTFANDVTAYNGAFSDSEASYLYRQQQEGNIIYEDFNVRYRLAAEAGEFRLKYYQRISGVFGFRSISEKAGIVQMPNIPSIKDISESLETLSSINQNIDELIQMKVPYGETAQNYEKLTAYLYKANKIHAQLSKTVNK